MATPFSFSNSTRLDPVCKLLIDCSEVSVSFCNIVASWDRLRVQDTVVGLAKRLELGRISCSRIVSSTIELWNLIAIGLWQDRAHLDVCESHPAGIFFFLSCQILIHRISLVLAHHILIIGLSNGHQSIFAWLTSKVYVLFHKLVFESSLFLLLLLCILIQSNICLLWSRNVVSLLAEVDRIGWLWHSLSTDDLSIGHLVLTYHVVSLACGGGRPILNPVGILDRKVASLNSFTSLASFIVPADKHVGRRSRKHRLWASLIGLFIDTEGEVARPQILSLLSNLLSHIRIACISFGTSRIRIIFLMPVLLHCGERLVIALETLITNLNLMHVWGAFLRVAILVGPLSRQLVGLVHPFISFKLITLLEAHFEIVLAVLSRLLYKLLLRHNRNIRVLLHTALVFRQVIELMTTQAEVRLDATNASKHFISLLFPLLDRLHFLLVWLAALSVAILGCAFRKIIVLRWQVRLSQLVDELETLGFLVGVIVGPMVREVFPILRQAVESLIVSELPIAWGEVSLLDDVLGVPLLSYVFLFLNGLGVKCPRVARIAKLEVGRLDLLGLLDSGLFSDVLTNFLSLDGRLGLVVGVLWAGTIDLAIGAGT